MDITLEIDSTADPKWDERLKNSPYGTIFHSEEMGHSKSLRNQIPIFLKFVSNSGEIVGQQLLFSFNRIEMNKSLKKLFNKIIPNTVIQWTYGPVIFNLDYTKQIISLLQNYFLKNNFKLQGTEHPFLNNIFSDLTNPFVLKEQCTFIIDLENELEHIWNNMDKHSVRKNIKRSEERGVYIKEMNKSNYLEYRKLSIQSGKDSDLSTQLIEKQWDFLTKVGYTGFLAYYDEEIVGGITVSYFNKYVNEFNIVRTEKDTLNKLYSQDLLKWKIIKWSKENGFKYFDFTGANPHPSNSKEEGIFRYKRKWGGVQKNFLQIIR